MSALGFKARVNPSLACNGFLRFTFGVAPADLLRPTWQLSLFDPHTCNVYKLWCDSHPRSSEAQCNMLTKVKAAVTE